MANNKPETWTLDGLLTHIHHVHETMPDTQFGWILGAGASKSSGIPTGWELVKWWLQELHERECDDGSSLKEWATKENLGFKKFKYKKAAAFYPQIYERRFRNQPETGYAYLENVMTGMQKRHASGRIEEVVDRPIEPGIGYSMLAKILEAGRHQAVVTTNFDNLVADAIQIFTDKYPFVCGHESLAEFVHTVMRRPLVCKIHRDLFLEPFNESRKLRRLHESWSSTLRSLFSHYSPIVIGYGGNDESLMGRLQSLEPGEIKGRLIWCYYEGEKQDNKPSKKIKELVSELNGVLVPVPELDELMVLIGTQIGIEPPDDDLKDRFEKQLGRFKDQLEDMAIGSNPRLAEALIKTYEKSDMKWWYWQIKIDALSHDDEKEKLFREAIKNCPKSSELLYNFAIFLKNNRKKFDEAEESYRKALELDPDDTDTLVSFAIFLSKIRNQHDKAEKFFRKALELAPNDADTLVNFAIFLKNIRNSYDEAEELYRKALEHTPGQADNLVKFAYFLTEIRKEHDEAREYFRKAVELQPEDLKILSCYVACLIHLEKFDEALNQIQQARKFIGDKNEQVQLLGELLIYVAVVQFTNGDSTEETFLELQSLLDQSFVRADWFLDVIYESAIFQKLSAKDQGVLRAYGDAILDEEKAKVLAETLAGINKPKSPAKKRAVKKKKASPRKKKKS